MNKDILEDLFDQMPSEKPTVGFRDNLIHRIELEKVKRAKRESQWMLIGLIVSSLALVAIAILGTAYLMGEGYTYPKIDLSGLKLETQPDFEKFKFPAIIGSITLFLLFSDHYLRQRFMPKKMSDN